MRVTLLMVLSAMLLIVSGCGSGRGKGQEGPTAVPRGQQREADRIRERQREAERVREKEREAERVHEKEREAERVHEKERAAERVHEKERAAERVREKEREAGRHPAPGLTVGTQRPRPCRVCAQQQTSVHLQPGRSTKVTWTVTGTTHPARVHLKNRYPDAVRVKGGDDQYATSSGGTPNIVTREVTALREGVFKVDVDVDEQELIPALYRSELRRIAAETEAAADRLRAEGRQGRRTIPTAAVLKVIDDAVADVERSLPFEELTAFRDAVRERANEIRREVLASSIASRTDSAAIHLVASRSSDEENTSDEETPAPKARSALSRFIDYLFGASKVGPLVEICAVTHPVDGATLTLYPKSAPNTTEHRTAKRFPIYVGLYIWKLRKTGFLASEGEVNFLTDPDRIFECTLRGNAGDANACDLVFGRLNQRCRR
jgi:hypothetical protein